jgi:hypothetical protein
MKNLLEEFMNSGVFEENKKQLFTEPIYKKRIKKENSVTVEEYNDVVKEREYWRKDALYWEDNAKKWKAAYERLQEKHEAKQ